MKRTPSFGSYLRGCRLGYGWSNRLQAFMRLSFERVCGKEIILAEFAPDGKIPSKKTPTNHHHCWWDSGDEIFDHSIALRSIKQVKEPFSMRLELDGRLFA